MATPRLSDDEKKRRKQSRATQQPTTREEAGAAIDEEAQTTQAAGIEINVEDAPQGIFAEEKKPGVLESVLTKLGIKDDPKAPPVKIPVTAKLNAAQSQFCDMATPIAGSILIISLGWAWGQLDEDYRALAPSSEMAESITAPLIRIYARSNKALIRAASPNTVDALMALNALIMYVHASLTLLHQINAMKKEGELDANTPRNINTARPAEARPHSASVRRNDLSRAAHGSIESDVTNSDTQYPSGLSEREQRNFASLSELRERDIAARARRSGRHG